MADSYLKASPREASAAAKLAASNKVVKYMLDCHHRGIRLGCGGVPRPNQQGCSSVLERVGQLAIGGDDRGCSSIFVFIPTDFHSGATI